MFQSIPICILFCVGANDFDENESKYIQNKEIPGKLSIRFSQNQIVFISYSSTK